MELQNKIAIVTGGDRGIGKAISIALAYKGAHSVVSYHREKEKAKETIETIKKAGVRSFEVQVDVRDYDQVQNMIKLVMKRLGHIDILVNNAGISGSHADIGNIDIQEWKELIDVNLTGVFTCCKAAQAELKKNKGKIVNISSIAGKMGGTIGCHYAASKAGVIGLTFALAQELAPRVTVNAVAPGPVDTGLISPEVMKKLSKQTPFGRVARPEEIAHTVIYLLENDYVSGEVVDVNAARYMD